MEQNEAGLWQDRIISYIEKNHISTTEISDCLGKSGVLPNIKSICQGNYRVGAVHWVYGYKESNWSVHEQIRQIKKGEVVFIETFQCGERAIVGELVSKYLLVYQQASAIISNSPFRDANNLLKERYPIWCTGFTPVGCFNEERAVIDNMDNLVLEEHKKKYDGTIAVCDDSGVVIIPSNLYTHDFYEKLCAIEEQEDIWFNCLDRLKWDTYEIVCQKKYLE